MNMGLCICREQEEEEEDQVEEAEKEDDDEEEEANIEEYELNCFNFKLSITNSFFTGQRVCDQQDLDFLSKIRKNS